MNFGLATTKRRAHCSGLIDLVESWQLLLRLRHTPMKERERCRLQLEPVTKCNRLTPASTSNHIMTWKSLPTRGLVRAHRKSSYSSRQCFKNAYFSWEYTQ